jgi:hypothetical protein
VVALAQYSCLTSSPLAKEILRVRDVGFTKFAIPGKCGIEARRRLKSYYWRIFHPEK